MAHQQYYPPMPPQQQQYYMPQQQQYFHDQGDHCGEPPMMNAYGGYDMQQGQMYGPNPQQHYPMNEQHHHMNEQHNPRNGNAKPANKVEPMHKAGRLHVGPAGSPMFVPRGHEPPKQQPNNQKPKIQVPNFDHLTGHAAFDAEAAWINKIMPLPSYSDASEAPVEFAEPRMVFREEDHNTVPGEQIIYGCEVYVVKETLQQGTNDPKRMSNGVRVLQRINPNRKFFVVEKNLMAGSDKAFTRVKIEIAALKQIRDAGGSPHINTIIDEFWAEGSRSCTILLEHCDIGTLEQEIQRMNAKGMFLEEFFMWDVLESVLKALCFCHYGIRNAHAPKYKLNPWNTICHLDIKPANLFVTSKMYPGNEYGNHRIVLGDFGCAVTLVDIQTKRTTTECMPGATAGWTPPEITYDDAKGYVGIFGKPTDVWQLGGLIQVMCRRTQLPQQEFVKEGRPCGGIYSVQLNDVVSRAMMEDHKTRPSALDLFEIVQRKKREYEDSVVRGGGR
ncbi:uncharacterized protein LTR77_011200 [Saxophila tyrrhenica]|uniref:non-specific serine/threonine protein kinase n=1 Tax=Saxophila tyrrhenica TaxID=1690608 RepID=A0AAV9NT96_9PEZI|nr:hypothetical protein LTR77_011200 [Saxophila tyrrhenica]